jgi:N-acetylneuraminic acid mutarotase
MNRRRFIAGTSAFAVALGSMRRTSAEATPTAGWGSAAPLPVGRSEFAATVLDGMIYVAGGFGAESLFDRYDPATDSWEALADLPEPRHHLSLAAGDGGVYLAGGHNQSANSATDTFWRFDVESGAWETLEPLPQGPRGALGAAAIDGSIYVAGGSSGDLSGPATADLVRYDIASSTWSLLAPMPTAREHLAVAAVDTKIVAVGGRNGGHETHALLSATEVYDPASDSWSVGAELPVPRAGLGVATFEKSVIIIGGERFTDDQGASISEAFASVDAYDAANDRWSELLDLPVARHGMAAAVVDGVLYGIGGSTVAGQVANVDRVDTLILA